MPTPVQFMMQYRNLRVNAAVDDPVTQTCREVVYQVQLKKYFMMDWDAGTEERQDYNTVTRGSRNDVWFQAHKENIKTAAMGKGSPGDYELALEWAVRSGKVSPVNQSTLQTFCDEHLGIDCSGFVTNYLVAIGKLTYSSSTVRNTNAASYYDPRKAVNDVSQIRQGDLLVWMDGNRVKRNPGHIAVIESHVAQCRVGGNMCVVEATGASGANPKLLESMYDVERIIPKAGSVPCMMFIVRRHGVSGSRVCIIRP
jgi:hypothetical protein